MSAPPLPDLLLPAPPSSIPFTAPQKRIYTQTDLAHLPSTPAYQLLTAFLSHLSASITPLDPTTTTLASEFFTNSPTLRISPSIPPLISLLDHISSLTASAPPLPGPRRFGNTAFRTWHSLASEYITTSLHTHLPSSTHSGEVELRHYLIASLGSPQRLDYGTGHELDFAAFLCAVWKLGGLGPGDEKAIVFKVFDAYFKLIRKLVVEYNLEPAGSHGVWGLDDHFFLPYIFGSAQLTTYIPSTTVPDGAMETTLTDDAGHEHKLNLPKPADVTKPAICEEWAERNLYLAAVGFVHRVKKGPFWEHSPMLYDISGVQKGWGKVNEGMRRMYEKEVLGKFPVVQHFWFGGVFVWDGPIRAEGTEEEVEVEDETKLAEEFANTKAPWASAGAPPATISARPVAAAAIPTTTAPWASAPSTRQPPPPTAAPWATATPRPAPSPSSIPPTAAPWANTTSSSNPMAPTAAPWASSITPTRTPPQPSPPLRDPFATGPNISASSSGNRPEEPIKTSAHLGPVRTKSPDSAAAAAANGKANQGRSDSVGSALVAETGDLKELAERRRSSVQAAREVAGSGV